jgi:hypothetical protein
MKARRGLGLMLTVLKDENTLSAAINAKYRVMSPVSLVPEQDLHFVLCDFGRSGQSYVETDPAEADASTIVRNLLRGQYDRPVRVLALNVEEGWVRDVSEIIAAKVQYMARREEQGLTAGTRAFIEAHSDPADQQQVLPLWQ